MRIPGSSRTPLLAAAVAMLALLGLAGCNKTPPDTGPRAGDLPVDTAFQKKLQGQLLDAQPGTVIEIPAGRYQIGRAHV